MAVTKLQDFEMSEIDGASVMVKFGRITKYLHQQCYNHALHLAVLDVIQKKESVLSNNSGRR